MTKIAEHWNRGRPVDATGNETSPLFNPATGVQIGEVVLATEDEVNTAVASAKAALPAWSAVPITDRALLLRAIANLLEEKTPELTEVLAEEIGSPIWFSKALQVPMPVRNLRAMAKALETIELTEMSGTSMIIREPIGVVAAITPWNAPFHQIVAKLGGVIAAGCTAVLKPSEIAPRSAIAFMQILHDAGVPPGVVELVFGGAAVGQLLSRHPDIDMVSFTGSVGAGKQVGATASGAIKKVGLELGGKSAAIVLDDADLVTAVTSVMRLCFANSGQVCVAHTRLLVPRSRLEDVEAICRSAATEWLVGDPLDPDTRLGPLATKRGYETARKMIGDAIAEGAVTVTGGLDRQEGWGEGYFVAPTVLSNVRSDSHIATEEVFGPVLVLLPYDTVEQAIEIANSTNYGLSGGVWSENRTEALAVARRIVTGQVSINGAPQNFATPFGGRGLSGVGRENGRFSIEEFLEYKAVHGVV